MVPSDAIEEVKRVELDASGKVGRMFEGASRGGVLGLMDERMRVVCRSTVTIWWYLFWVSMLSSIPRRILICSL